jgi:hypothetical protein
MMLRKVSSDSYISTLEILKPNLLNLYIEHQNFMEMRK